jgi:hypothetical protein
LLWFTVPLLLLADVAPKPRWAGEVREAAAIASARDPVSAAGVARRTTRRVVAVEATAATSASAQQQQAAAQQQQATAQQQAATAAAAGIAQQQSALNSRQSQRSRLQGASAAYGTVVTALPAGTSAPKGRVDYQKCGKTYYRAAFQGNNLVYVVAQP